MAARSRTPGRLTSFRLSDLPQGVLQRGANLAIRMEEDPFVALAIGALANNPPAKIKWIPLDAYEAVMGPRHGDVT